MKLQSRVCEILEIEQPIVLAGMVGPAVLLWPRRYPMPVVWACSVLRPVGQGNCGSGFAKLVT